MSRELRNRRPPTRTGPAPTMKKRQAMAQRGAQYSPTLGQWIGWLFDGLLVTVFEARTNRARALQDAHDHYDRIFHPQMPARQWTAAR